MILRILIIVGASLAAAAGLTACAGPSFLNAITSTAGYAVVPGVRYAQGQRGTYDLYIPDGARPDTPVVVFVYGGSWDTGSKDIYRFLGQAFTQQNLILAVPDYRLYPEVTFPGFVEDAAKAVAAIDAAARSGASSLPAGRHPLFLMGHSAGAEIAGLLATDERYLRGVGLPAGRIAGFIGLAGPYDFLPLTEERYKRIFPERTRAASQPVNFVDGREPPMLLIAGDKDDTVDPKNTLSLAAKVRAAGGEATATIVAGIDHIGAVSAFSTVLPLGDASIPEAVFAFIGARS